MKTLAVFLAAAVLAVAGGGATSAVAAPLVVSNAAPSAEGVGYLPPDGATVSINPPPFAWLPEKGAKEYLVQVATAADFKTTVAQAVTPYVLYAHTAALEPGTYYWRYRFHTAAGGKSGWSSVRRFAVPADAPRFVRPTREAVAAAVPREHPRAYIRPENLADLRASRGRLPKAWAQLSASADEALTAPLMAEPKPWTNDTWNMPEWSLYFGQISKAHLQVQALAFAYLVSGDERYGQAAKKWLMHWTTWDPLGPSSVKVNDEITMPIVYAGSRAYSWIRPLLNDDEAARVRAMMRVRVGEMHKHLRRAPYEQFPLDSHAGRIWHIVGESASIFHDEIPEAPEWLEWAMHIYYGWYPYWGDNEGGWAEGLHYFASYNEHALTWHEQLRGVLGIDSTAKPFYANVGDFPMYAAPPGGAANGFGDFSEQKPSVARGRVVAYYAAARGNPHWQWFAEQVSPGGAAGPIGYLRAFRPTPKAEAPAPDSPLKVFPKAGWAVFNSALTDPDANVQLQMRSSPYGNVSHSHQDQNGIVVAAFGSPLLVNTGFRDFYGSTFCKVWYWATVAHNAVLVGGAGQDRGAETSARIVAHGAKDGFAWAVGDATPAYVGRASRVRRHLAFVKGETIVVVDEVQPTTATTVELMFHGRAPFATDDAGQRFGLEFGKAALSARVFAPRPVVFKQTDQYTIPPESERKPTPEWHLQAQLRDVPTKSPSVIVTVMDIHRAGAQPAITECDVIRAGDKLAARWTRQGKVQQVNFDLGKPAAEFGSE